jgi:hypothetical protein
MGEIRSLARTLDGLGEPRIDRKEALIVLDGVPCT